MTKERVLAIEIFQPYAQYRNPFTFYYAQTFPLPPKTAVIGMLQNATDRYYDQEFWNLKVSIHGGFESVFWNYQQLIKGTPKIGNWDRKITIIGSNDNKPLYGLLKSQRTPVYQQELFNGHLYIFLKGDDGLLREIRDALSEPKKVLYLGRSEDIVYIKSVNFVESSKVLGFTRSLSLEFPTYIKHKGLPLVLQKYPVYSIPTYSVFRNGDRTVSNKAEIMRNKTERETKFETVIYTGYDFNLRVNAKEQIRFHEYIICDKRFRILEDYGWL